VIRNHRAGESGGFDNPFPEPSRRYSKNTTDKSGDLRGQSHRPGQSSHVGSVQRRPRCYGKSKPANGRPESGSNFSGTVSIRSSQGNGLAPVLDLPQPEGGFGSAANRTRVGDRNLRNA